MKRTGPLLKTWRGSVLVLFFFPLVALAGPSSREPLFSPDELLEISHHPQWHALLHYEPHLFGGVKSRIDDPNFFLAPTGQEDPAAELEATLELFFGIGSSPPEKVEGEIAPRCRFVARYHWLRSLLGEERYGEEEGLPCHRFREWRDAIAPWGVTMVFPSAFVNSPASAFGHTLLRIDAKDQSESSRLLAYTASYAAATGGEDPISYALRGMFGGYPGYFTVFPYYETVKKYSDLEHRDIWEYQIAVTPEETEFLVMHLWELQQIFSRYLYFDENCAYQMLALLNVLWPEKEMLSGLKPWIIPVDVLRRVLSENGVLKKKTFRPAEVTKMRALASSLSEEERQWARKMGEGEKEVEGVSAPTLELAYQYLNYRHSRGELSEEESRKLGLSLLRARSEAASGRVPAVREPQVSPDEGHRTSRLRIQSGVRDDQAFGQFRFRGAHHDLLDPLPGFIRGAQIEIVEVALDHEEGGTTRLESVELLELFSLSPRDAFVRPKSWRVSAEVKRERFSSSERKLTSELSFGYGLSWEIGELLFYALGGSEFESSAHLHGEYAVGTGALFGILSTTESPWAFHLTSGVDRLWGDTHTEQHLTGEGRYTIAPDTAARIAFSRVRDYTTFENAFSLSVDWYF